MGLEDPTTIDVVSESADGEIGLIMTETRRWDGSPERSKELQDKLNTYVAFVESGRLVEEYPEAQGRAVRIQLDTLEEPDAQTRTILEHVERRLAEESIRFVVERYPQELVEAVRAGIPLEEVVARARDGASLDEIAALARARRDRRRGRFGRLRGR